MRESASKRCVRTVRNHPEVEEEVAAAAEYIEHERAGYGEMFLDEIAAARALIGEDPNRWAFKTFGFRRYVTERFKYLIWYREQDGEVFVIAVHHPSRRPGYWKDRI